MGRYFRTASPQYVDYAYRLPVDLMATVIKSADAGVDKTIEDIEQLRLKYTQDTKNNVNSMYLPQMKRLQEESLMSMMPRLMHLQKGFRKNPLEFKSMSGDIAKLREM